MLQVLEIRFMTFLICKACAERLITFRVCCSGFGNSMWMAYGGLVHQGVDIEARSYAGRMITGTWWYFTMLVIAAYTANLTAFLTQEFSEEVANLEELLQQVQPSLQLSM